MHSYIFNENLKLQCFQNASIILTHLGESVPAKKNSWLLANTTGTVVMYSHREEHGNPLIKKFQTGPTDTARYLYRAFQDLYR